MANRSPQSLIFQSLYRSLLKQARIIDQSPIHQCFLISKPRKIYVHEYGTPVNVRLTNSDFEVIERILNDHCGGEYFAPSYPNQPSKSLSSVIRTFARFGIPAHYDSHKILCSKSKSASDLLNTHLELAFYAKKRLSHATNVIDKMTSGQEAQFMNAFHSFSMALQHQSPPTDTEGDAPSADTTESAGDEKEADSQSVITSTITSSPRTQSGSGSGHRFTKIPLTQQFSIKSLVPLISEFRSISPSKEHGDECSAESEPAPSDKDNVFTKDKLPTGEDPDAPHLVVPRGTLLISHPMACIGQPDLYRKVIYVIENSPDRIVGITMNAAHSIFDDRPRRHRRGPRSDRMSVANANQFEHCLRGWRGEWNYVGGPVNDQSCPFCILHENDVFYGKFKKSSSVLIDGGRGRPSVYWTWVTADNYKGIYEALNQITKCIRHREEGTECGQHDVDGVVASEPEEAPDSAQNADGTEGVESGSFETAECESIESNVSESESVETRSEISGKLDEELGGGLVDDAQIVSENVQDGDLKIEAVDEEEEEKVVEVEDITKDEFYESIMNDGSNHFKFFQKYSYWSPEQLVVEIKNNVWFPAKLMDVEEERQLLNLKCPSSKLLKQRNMFRGSDSGGDHKKQFNKWQWQAFVKALGNEFQYLSLFPDLNNEQTKEFYEFMTEFHASWVPDVEEGAFDSDDEPEEQGTVW